MREHLDRTALDSLIAELAAERARLEPYPWKEPPQHVEHQSLADRIAGHEADQREMAASKRAFAPYKSAMTRLAVTKWIASNFAVAD